MKGNKLVIIGIAAAAGIAAFAYFKKRSKQAMAATTDPTPTSIQSLPNIAAGKQVQPELQQPHIAPAVQHMPTDVRPPNHERNRPLPGVFPFNPVAVPHRDPFTLELVPVDDPFPRQQIDVVVQYILNKIVAELAANDFLTPDEKAELYQEILDQYYSELLEIARLNDFRLSPLVDAARSKYSALILLISHHNDVFLNPSSRAIHRGQMFVNPSHIKGRHGTVTLT